MLGPGWAVIASTLAVGGLTFEASFWQVNGAWLLNVVLFWLLADPILGTLWHFSSTTTTTQKKQPETLKQQLNFILPYSRKDSGAYRLAILITRLSHSQEAIIFLLLLVVALIIALILGTWVMIYVVVFGLSLLWFSQNKESAYYPFWQSLVTFLIPYCINLLLMSNWHLPQVLLGLGYWVVYTGSLRLLTGQINGNKQIIAGQGAVSLLLFALNKPIAGIIVGVGLGLTLLFRLQVVSQQPVPWRQYTTQFHPPLLLGMLISAGTLGRWG
jgi:hypothetical protein